MRNYSHTNPSTIDQQQQRREQRTLTENTDRDHNNNSITVIPYRKCERITKANNEETIYSTVMS